MIVESPIDDTMFITEGCLKAMDIKECEGSIVLIRKDINELVGYRCGSIYYNKLQELKKMPLNEFMQMAVHKVSIASEEDWQKHPQYYMALTQALSEKL